MNDFYANNSAFEVSYVADSEFLGTEESATMHPRIVRRSTGKVVFDGIADVDLVGMFGNCKHGIRALCPKCRLVVDSDGCSSVEEHKRADTSGSAKYTKDRLRKMILRQKKRQDRKERQEARQAIKANVREYTEFYADDATNKEFCEKRGLPLRESDMVLADWLMNQISEGWPALK